MTEDDLLEGDVSQERRDLLDEELQHERWKRGFAKKLTRGVAALIGIMVLALLCYVFGYEHELADIPAIVALSAIPTILTIGLMRYFLPREPELPEEDESAQFPQIEMARQVVQLSREMSNSP